MREPARLARACAALVVDRIFPRFCLGCARRLGAGPAPLLLCAVCRGALEPVDPRASCVACARPLPHGRLELPRCLECARERPPQERLTAAWRYRPPLDRVLWALKFGRLEFLAEELVIEALATAAPLERPAAVVPVPLAWPRRLARGFNQAERIAAALAERLDAPCRPLLDRPGWRSRPQHRLGRRQRRANPAVRFRARPGLGPEIGANAGPLLLVDDVITTGSTLRAAGEALRGAGCCRRLLAFVLAATPPAPGPQRPFLPLLDSPCQAP